MDGWYPDADLYEYLITYMCTQEDLVDAAELIVRQELKVEHCPISQSGHLPVCFCTRLLQQ
jgi:hypothetical protein